MSAALKSLKPDDLTNFFESFVENFPGIYKIFIEILEEKDFEDNLCLGVAAVVNELCCMAGSSKYGMAYRAASNGKNLNGRDPGLQNYYRKMLNVIFNPTSCINNATPPPGYILFKILSKKLENISETKQINSKLKAYKCYSSALKVLSLVSEYSANQIIDTSGNLLSVIFSDLITIDKKIQLHVLSSKSPDPTGSILSYKETVLTMFHLLRNIFISDRTNTIKNLSRLDRKFLSILTNIYTWCKKDLHLKLNFILLLQAYTENFPEGCDELAKTQNKKEILSEKNNVDFNTNIFTNTISNNNEYSLLKILMDHLTETLHLVTVKVSTNEDILKNLYRLMTNMAAVSPSCRSMFWKHGFVEKLLLAGDDDRLTATKKSKLQRYSFKLWVNFLTALSYDSFSKDQMSGKILGQVNILEKLVDYYNSEDISLENSMLLIRNFSFDNKMKPKIAQNEKIIRILLVELENEDNYLVNLLAAEAIWAISNHTQRARAILKQKMVYDNLSILLSKREKEVDKYKEELGGNGLDNSQDSRNEVFKRYPYFDRLSMALKAGIELLS